MDKTRSQRRGTDLDEYRQKYKTAIIAGLSSPTFFSRHQSCCIFERPIVFDHKKILLEELCRDNPDLTAFTNQNQTLLLVFLQRQNSLWVCQFASEAYFLFAIVVLSFRFCFNFCAVQVHFLEVFGTYSFMMTWFYFWFSSVPVCWWVCECVH